MSEQHSGQALPCLKKRAASASVCVACKPHKRPRRSGAGQKEEAARLNAAPRVLGKRVLHHDQLARHAVQPLRVRVAERQKIDGHFQAGITAKRTMRQQRGGQDIGLEVDSRTVWCGLARNVLERPPKLIGGSYQRPLRQHSR